MTPGFGIAETMPFDTMACLSEHERWMGQALRQSRKALPDCIPNPPVGCVIVDCGQILALGYTCPPGQHHAEAMALRNLTTSAIGASVYVTLEPCSFYGRTPPCATALVTAGISRVYVGLVDPDPRNRGRGLELLRTAGIVVEVGVLANEIERFVGPYLIRT